MSKFIELTHKHSGSKFLININKIEAVDVFEGDVIVSLGESEDDFFTVTESYEQVKHLVGTEKPLDNGDIAENKTIDTKQAIEWLKQFDNAQREQIIFGLERGVDVSLYAKKEFNWDQMMQIRMGQYDGVDATHYARVEFDFMQMAQIRCGLQSGIDVSLYLDPKIPSQEMKNKRLELEREKKGDTK